MLSPLLCMFYVKWNLLDKSIGCSGGDRLRTGLKCVGGGTERAGCAMGEDMNTLLLTTSEQKLAELQVMLSRSWEEGLPKRSLWWREPAGTPSIGCFTTLWVGWAPQPCCRWTPQDSLSCWREKGNLVAVSSLPLLYLDAFWADSYQ